MEALYRYANGCAGSLVALFAPVAPLMWCVAAFIGVDFATGVAASRAEARRDGRAWYFESREAWRTVRKLGFAIVAIAMARIVDTLPAGLFPPDFARLFAGFVCGVEMWSFLENACRMGDSRLLRRLRRFVREAERGEVRDE